MIEEILKALATKFEGLSENVLKPTATRLSKSASKAEDIDELLEGVTLQQVIDSYSDKRATDATQTAVSNYEKKHSLRDGKAIKSSDEGSNDKSDPNQNEKEVEDERKDPALKAVLEELKTLRGELEGMKSEKVTTSRRETITALIKDLPAFQQKVYSKIDLTAMSDEDFNTFREETETNVKDALAEIRASGAKFDTPPANHGGAQKEEATQKEASDLIAGMDLKM